MTNSNAVKKASSPLPAYNFRVTVDTESASFTEVVGVAIEYEPVTYRHGFSRWQGEMVARVPKLSHATVTLKKGTTAGNTFLMDWLTADPPAARAIAISLCDEAGAPVVVWHINQAIPVKVAARAFRTAAHQPDIET